MPPLDLTRCETVTIAGRAIADIGHLGRSVWQEAPGLPLPEDPPQPY
ncbi:hypothetical protein [Paracoccus spongiarum]|uniref:Uncharacterized protein n=1 Tax=Paracoccus spongiarum TaxID=3064387 RepID=A0ABT9JC93_9RHOB|nr:hypothetical protein [Paracoccus sp. 2205BS29-5]MDP5307464.1 hypothetical protein [Paracoccus sp. 2205BS29-5]